jgi:hypothetical protein
MCVEEEAAARSIQQRNIVGKIASSLVAYWRKNSKKCISSLTRERERDEERERKTAVSSSRWTDIGHKRGSSLTPNIETRNNNTHECLKIEKFSQTHLQVFPHFLIIYLFFRRFFFMFSDRDRQARSVL